MEYTYHHLLLLGPSLPPPYPQQASLQILSSKFPQLPLNSMLQGPEGYPVAHKTVPMFGCFGQMVLVQSDDIINGLGSHVQQTTLSWLSKTPWFM